MLIDSQQQGVGHTHHAGRLCAWLPPKQLYGLLKRIPPHPGNRHMHPADWPLLPLLRLYVVVVSKTEEQQVVHASAVARAQGQGRLEQHVDTISLYRPVCQGRLMLVTTYQYEARANPGNQILGSTVAHVTHGRHHTELRAR